MNYLHHLLVLAETSSAEAATSQEGGASTGGNATESLKKIIQSPVFYIVIGAIVLLIIAIYLIRRFVKAKPGAKTIIIRGGKIHKVLDENNPKAFLVPFRDSVGGVIGSENRDLASDKLFINNGPDTLYKINYVLTYHVTDAVKYYPYSGRIQELLSVKLNDALRLYADQGNALVLVQEYRQSEDKILKVINEAIAEYSVEATSFKVNFIEPMGGK